MKSSEDTKQKQTNSGFFLGHWNEVVGEFIGVDKNDQWFRVRLNITLIFPAGGLEAKIVMKKLRKVKSGQVIGVLRTDSVENPIVVRIVEKQELIKGD